MKKIIGFLNGVEKELGKVRWPNKKEMITYSIATLTFIFIFAAFFTMTDIILAGIKMLVN
ncbi:MAG TPA: preprotein translocase subunit SecE [Tenericutes bacterium]|nr:preprotein translocase subunit SecE [Mycoplasmatota bacterium]